MSMKIEVDPIKCEAHGLCAELLPERITLDEWGYPLVDASPVPAALEDLAHRTVNACPTLALRLRAVQNLNVTGASRPRTAAPVRAGAPPSNGVEDDDRPYQLYTSKRRGPR